MDPQKTWTKIIDQIKQEVDAGNYRTWFSKTKLVSIQDNTLIIATPHTFIKNQLRVRYLPLLEKSAEIVLGQKTNIELIIDSALATKASKETDGDEEDGLFQDYAPISTQQSPIDPKYTLENFVVGLSNNVAYAAAQAIVQKPGSSYNPLFIYGGTGVGKTHLMLGIGNAILTKRPGIKIIFCSAEKFTNDYVQSIQTHRMGDLRSKYRSADLLLVDDAQFFSGRDQTQEEFFHTFNELMSKNSQIVLTSDRPPNEMPKLEDRLKSRFQGGLMVDIQQPDFDTRIAILKAKCLERGEIISDEALAIIASALETNTREIEGKLSQIVQTLKAKNLPPTPENIKELLGQRKYATSILNPKQVVTGICTYFNIKQTDLLGPKRQKELVLSRHLTMYILSEELKLTVEKIGEILGGRDHTTVMHGRDRIKNLLNTDSDVQRVFIEIKQALTL